MKYKFHDGGKFDCGFGKASSADCALRAICIAEGSSYRQTKAQMNELLFEMTGGLERSVNNGVANAVVYRFLMDLGYKLTLTGNLYLRDMESTFSGRTVICSLTRHFVTVIDNTVFDTWDCRWTNRTKCNSPKLEGYFEKM